MKPAATIAIIGILLTLPTSGCVQQDKYDQLLVAHRALQEQLVLVKDERDGYRSSLQSAQTEAQRYGIELGSLRTQYDQLEGEFGQLSSDTDTYLQQISSLELGPLPVDFASALDDLARAYPDLITFDVQNGMLRFNSDFTFDLASTQLKGGAEPTIAAIANIMNASTASSFDARVVGHTDNVPIRRAETKAKYPTNLHLSVGRAISVRDALVNAGVTPGRLEVAGWGEFHPTVPNGARGSAQNRRVELYFVPATRDLAYAPVNSSSSTPAYTEAAATGSGDFPMK